MSSSYSSILLRYKRYFYLFRTNFTTKQHITPPLYTNHPQNMVSFSHNLPPKFYHPPSLTIYPPLLINSPLNVKLNCGNLLRECNGTPGGKLPGANLLRQYYNFTSIQWLFLWIFKPQSFIVIFYQGLGLSIV